MDLAELAALNAVIGPFLVPVIAAVNQPRWPSWGRVLGTLAVCAVAGTITAAANGELTGVGWPTAVVSCAAGAMLAYQKLKPLATRIETATSRKDPDRNDFWGPDPSPEPRHSAAEDAT